MLSLNTVRIERQLDGLLKDLAKTGQTEACGHLSAAIGHLRLMRSVVGGGTSGGQCPMSFSLPTGALKAVRDEARRSGTTQTRVMVEALEQALALPASSTRTEPSPSDSRLSLRISPDLMRRLDARSLMTGVTRSQLLRDAVLSRFRPTATDGTVAP